MSNTKTRKISIALLIANIAFLIACFVMFFAQKGFIISPNELSWSYASLIVLGFGGNWEHSYPTPDKFGGNPAFAIAFIFLAIALILSVVLLYGYISKKFLPKTILNLTAVIIVLMLFVSITASFTKQTAASIYSQNLLVKKINILNYTKVTGSSIALIVFGFLSVASYIAFAAIPYIKNKITKK